MPAFRRTLLGQSTSYVGMAVACIPVAVLVSLAVRSFWRYSAGQSAHDAGIVADDGPALA